MNEKRKDLIYSIGEFIPNGVKFNEPLAEHTTFRIGGPAEFWVEPGNLKELASVIRVAKKKNIPLFIIGAGSNILGLDAGIKGIVISLNRGYFKKIEAKKNKILCGAGARLTFLLGRARSFNLGGLEFLSGIPGTFGGALAMNAGIATVIKNEKLKIKNGKTKTKSIGDLVEDITVMDYNGNIKLINKKNLDFGYRTSNLSGYVILNATLKLKKRNREKIKEDIDKYLSRRRMTQDLSCSSAGCIFKNPSLNESAGRLIDLCGLKGKSIGGAFVSLKHANFIFNNGNAKAGDVLRLMSLIRRKVKNKFNVELEPEIKIWP
ncbi:MAG: UDP-N-acetylmuramate dehydrogenase [Candidatus Omnitrophota bacterium]|nr:UDP-N-acetylmuramate dehydrogenase [Candidatus Omnitrophota bacterium]